jgi:hypothetical protein
MAKDFSKLFKSVSQPFAMVVINENMSSMHEINMLERNKIPIK